MTTIGDCAITCEKGIKVIKTKCCDQNIEVSAYYRIFIGGLGCPFCRDKTYVIPKSEISNILSESSHGAKEEYRHLPGVQSGIMVSHINKLFSKDENILKLIESIYKRLNFTDSYKNYIKNLNGEQERLYAIEYGSDKKIEEFFENYVSERVSIILNKMKPKLIKKLDKDKDEVIELILNSVRVRCNKDLIDELRKNHKTKLVDGLFEKIKKCILKNDKKRKISEVLYPNKKCKYQ